MDAPWKMESNTCRPDVDLWPRQGDKNDHRSSIRTFEATCQRKKLSTASTSFCSVVVFVLQAMESLLASILVLNAIRLWGSRRLG
jgi:hypothetical protein